MRPWARLHHAWALASGRPPCTGAIRGCSDAGAGQERDPKHSLQLFEALRLGPSPSRSAPPRATPPRPAATARWTASRQRSSCVPCTWSMTSMPRVSLQTAGRRQAGAAALQRHGGAAGLQDAAVAALTLLSAAAATPSPPLTRLQRAPRVWWISCFPTRWCRRRPSPRASRWVLAEPCRGGGGGEGGRCGWG